MALRQKLLILYLSNSALDSPVVGWARHDGLDHASPPEPGAEDEPVYARGVDALRDGWRLIQASPLTAHAPGSEFTTAYLKYEFLFEKLVDSAEGEEIRP